MRNNAFLQIKEESESEFIKINQNSEHKPKERLLKSFTFVSKAAPYYTRKCLEASQCEKLNFPSGIGAGSAQPLLSFCSVGITLMHSSVTSWATAGNNTSCHSQYSSPLIPVLCSHSTTVCTGAQHQLLVIFWGLQSRVFLLAGFSLKLQVDVRELKERGSIFKAILWVQNESSGTGWSEEQRCPHVNTRSL